MLGTWDVALALGIIIEPVKALTDVPVTLFWFLFKHLQFLIVFWLFVLEDW